MRPTTDDTDRYDMTDADWHEAVDKAMEDLHQHLEAELERLRQDSQTLARVRRVLADFLDAEVSASSLQPVLDLARELSPAPIDNTHPF